MRAVPCLVAVLVAGLAASACVARPTPTAAPTTGRESFKPSLLPTLTAAPSSVPESLKPSSVPQVSPEPVLGACVEGEPHAVAGSEWFEGTCYGWRVGAEDVLGGDSYDRNLKVDCEPELYGHSLETSGPPAVTHPTDLDIEFADLPSGATVEHIDKWACGSMGLSDHLTLTDAQGGGTVDITRSLEGTSWLPVWALPSSVKGCDVLGRPAVCIDYLVDGVDRRNDFAYVFVIEDRRLDPHAVVLRLYSEEVPLAELLQIAVRVVGA